MTFSLSHDNIDPKSYPLPGGADAGATVTFTGRVRGQSHGQVVDRLSYEGYRPLATKIGQDILDRAQQRYHLLDVLAIHRLGQVRPGDISLWIRASAPHRKEAFSACRFILEEIKRDLPVWKSEHYQDGTSQWLSNDPASPSPWPLSREQYYQRPLGFADIGPRGQEALRQARVLVVGAGGLGCAALTSLTQAGVGTIGICEFDGCELSNLHRQSLYGIQDIGTPKLPAAIQRLKQLNPFTSFVAHPERLSNDNVAVITTGYDVVLDGTDNFASKYLLNDFCYEKEIPLIHAAIYQHQGQILVVRGKSAPGCLRCLWPKEPPPHISPGTSAGVIGTTPQIFGHLQALEAIKIILDWPGQLYAEMLMLRLDTYDIRKMRLPASPECLLCRSTSKQRVS